MTVLESISIERSRTGLGISCVNKYSVDDVSVVTAMSWLNLLAVNKEFANFRGSGTSIIITYLLKMKQAIMQVL